MIQRTVPQFGNLMFDRDAIVRASMRAYVEALFGNIPLRRLSFPASAGGVWTGDFRRGAVCNYDGCGDNEVIAWTETGVVGLAFELGFGPMEQLGLLPSAVTRGPDDVRGAVPGLPPELEPAFVMASGMLADGPEYLEKMASAGLWLYGEQVGGSMFDDPTGPGVRQLAAWGLLRGGRLWPLSAFFCGPNERAIVVEQARKEAHIHAIIDAVTDRALQGPTQFTAEEIATLIPKPPKPADLAYAQETLAKVGITWPSSPEIPPEAR
ncbi:MAG: hypothetical protein IPK82_08135 [Polyangiaceae bacterium]|nr:hypothetical protein [Polyangiaceae bacterium]